MKNSNNNGNENKTNKRFKDYKIIIWVSIFALLIICSILIIPPVHYYCNTKQFGNFDSNNYYDFTGNIVGGIIGGVLTLWTIFLQFNKENKRKREEKYALTRGFFELNYIEPYFKNIKS